MNDAMIRHSLRAACVVAAVIAGAGVAQAQVYKCTEDGKTVYQQRPCKKNDAPIELNVHHPDDHEVRAAQIRALKDKVDAIEVDIAQEEAYRKRQEAYARRDAEQKRCDQLLKDADAADQEAGYWFHGGIRQRQTDRAKQLRDKHFSECFSRGK